MRPRPPRQHLLCRLVLASAAVSYRPCRWAALATRLPWSSLHVLPCLSRLHHWRSSRSPFRPPFTRCRSSILHGPLIPPPPGRAVPAGAAAEALCAAAAAAASPTQQGAAHPPAAAPAQEREATAAGASPAKRAEREAGTLTNQRDATPNLLRILPTQSDSLVVLPLPLAWLRTPSQLVDRIAVL